MGKLPPRALGMSLKWVDRRRRPISFVDRGQNRGLSWWGKWNSIGGCTTGSAQVNLTLTATAIRVLSASVGAISSVDDIWWRGQRRVCGINSDFRRLGQRPLLNTDAHHENPPIHLPPPIILPHPSPLPHATSSPLPSSTLQSPQMTKPKQTAPTLKTAALTKESIFTADMVDVKVGANVDYFLPEPSFTISSVHSEFGKSSIKDFVLAELKEHLITAMHTITLVDMVRQPNKIERLVKISHPFWVSQDCPRQFHSCRRRLPCWITTSSYRIKIGMDRYSRNVVLGLFRLYQGMGDWYRMISQAAMVLTVVRWRISWRRHARCA